MLHSEIKIAGKLLEATKANKINWTRATTNYTKITAFINEVHVCITNNRCNGYDMFIITALQPRTSHYDSSRQNEFHYDCIRPDEPFHREMRELFNVMETLPNPPKDPVTQILEGL